jgi:hypothetical protein
LDAETQVVIFAMRSLFLFSLNKKWDVYKKNSKTIEHFIKIHEISWSI